MTLVATTPMRVGDIQFKGSIIEEFKTFEEIPEIELPVINIDETSSEYFPLTEDERYIVIHTVIAEAGCESLEGQMAIAQCIRDTAQYKNLPVTEVVKVYRYAKPYSKDDKPYIDKATEAVTRVFTKGEDAVAHRIMYFYAPKRVYSKWHESQNYIVTIGNHKFFDEKEH